MVTPLRSPDAPPSVDAVLARCAHWITTEPDLAAQLAVHTAAESFRIALIDIVRARSGEADAAALAAHDSDRGGAHSCRLAAWPSAQRRSWQPIVLEWSA